MSENAADRNLLFGILALQMDFITRDAIVAAMNAWVLDKGKSLGQILVEQRALSFEHRALLEPLVDAHLEQHGDDPARSLATVGPIGPVRDDLNQIADPDIHVTLPNLATSDGASDSDPEATPAYVDAPNDTKGRFRILRFHAEGGLGRVSVAFDEELNREVALKEIKREYDRNATICSRFLLEAELTGHLEHPGIVPVYGLGWDADGRPFYAMRFIKGESLRNAIARFHRADADPKKRDVGERALALRELLGRFIDACNAVAYAHSRGVIHRDLKPGNVMLGPFGETLVVDWGLAKVVGRPDVTDALGDATLRPPSSGNLDLTRHGSAIGTPAYMSPEQAAGQLDRIDPRSDVYSLGATLYTLLTDRAPIEDREVDVALAKAVRGEIPAPREVKPGTPPALGAICRKATALRPEDRYATPKELADDLKRWLADEPVSALPEIWARRLGRWIYHYRGLAVLINSLIIGFFIFIVCTQLITSFFIPNRPRIPGPRPGPRDVSSFSINGRFPHLYFHETENGIYNGYNLDSYYYEAKLNLYVGDADSYRRNCARWVQDFGQTNEAPEAKDIAWACALIPGALRDLTPAVRLAEKAVIDDPNSLHLRILGAVLHRAGRHEEAIIRLGEAIQVHPRGGNGYDWLFLALAHHAMGHTAEVEQWLSRAATWIERAEKGELVDSGVGRLTKPQSFELRLLLGEARSVVADLGFPDDPFAR